MLEIVHDIAPDAELYFRDCGSNTLDFADGIDALADAGCTIICDDIGWINDPFFEDGALATHIQIAHIDPEHSLRHLGRQLGRDALPGDV